MLVPDEEFWMAFGRLEGKVTSIKESLDLLLPDHEERIRTLERWKWMVLGGSIALSSLATFAVHLLSK